MLIPTEAIAIAPAISSAPASSSTQAGLSAQRPPVSSGSPDPSSQTPKSTQHGSHWLSPGYSRTYDHTSTHKGRVSPKLEGGCHSSLGSSGDISISHSGVSCGHRNVPHASDSHYEISPDSSGLRRPPSRTLLH